MKYNITSKTKFYLGDPCYALKDDIYDNVWGGNNYADGVHTDPDTGLQFAIIGTVIGDGYYPGRFLTSTFTEDYYEFPVDAGAIAIIPVELCDAEKLAEAVSDEYGYVVDYTGEVSISRKGNTWDDDIVIFVEWARKIFGIEIQYANSDEDDYDYDRRTEMPWDYGRHFDDYDDYEDDDYDDPFPFETDWE